jgi:hypothetical protein
VEEEITCSYLDDATAPYSDRQARLSDDFSFDCQCMACIAPPHLRGKSDKRLKRFQHLRKAWSDISRDPDDHRLQSFALKDNAIARLSEAIQILKAENRINELDDLYELTFLVHAMNGRRIEAAQAARTACDHFILVRGGAIIGELDYAELRKDPTSFQGYGRLLDDEVSYRTKRKR